MFLKLCFETVPDALGHGHALDHALGMILPALLLLKASAGLDMDLDMSQEALLIFDVFIDCLNSC